MTNNYEEWTPTNTAINDKQLLANEFNEFFIAKGQTIMNNLQPSDDNPIDITYIKSDYLTKARFNTSQRVTEGQVPKLVQKYATKSCELDQIPASLLKMHLDVMVPVLQHIANVSLTEGHFSSELKVALLRPPLKWISLDLFKKKYRPVLNLSYLSKLIEWAVCDQLTSKAAQSGNLEELQSAYREHHSLKMAILKVKSYLPTAMDNKEVTSLLLLDSSATFDTLNHKPLLNRLKYRFDINGMILQWIESYVTNQTQRVKVEYLESDWVTLTF